MASAAPLLRSLNVRAARQMRAFAPRITGTRDDGYGGTLQRTLYTAVCLVYATVESARSAWPAQQTLLFTKRCARRWLCAVWSPRVDQRDAAAVRCVQLVDEPTMKILREFDINKPGHTLMVPLNEGKNFTDKKLRDVNTFQQFGIDPSTMTTAAATQVPAPYTAPAPPN